MVRSLACRRTSKPDAQPAISPAVYGTVSPVTPQPNVFTHQYVASEQPREEMFMGRPAHCEYPNLDQLEIVFQLMPGVISVHLHSFRLVGEPH